MMIAMKTILNTQKMVLKQFIILWKKLQIMKKSCKSQTTAIA